MVIINNNLWSPVPWGWGGHHCCNSGNNWMNNILKYQFMFGMMNNMQNWFSSYVTPPKQQSYNPYAAMGLQLSEGGGAMPQSYEEYLQQQQDAQSFAELKSAWTEFKFIKIGDKYYANLKTDKSVHLTGESVDELMDSINEYVDANPDKFKTKPAKTSTTTTTNDTDVSTRTDDTSSSSTTSTTQTETGADTNELKTESNVPAKQNTPAKPDKNHQYIIRLVYNDDEGIATTISPDGQFINYKYSGYYPNKIVNYMKTSLNKMGYSNVTIRCDGPGINKDAKTNFTEEEKTAQYFVIMQYDKTNKKAGAILPDGTKITCDSSSEPGTESQANTLLRSQAKSLGWTNIKFGWNSKCYFDD